MNDMKQKEDKEKEKEGAECGRARTLGEYGPNTGSI